RSVAGAVNLRPGRPYYGAWRRMGHPASAESAHGARKPRSVARCWGVSAGEEGGMGAFARSASRAVGLRGFFSFLLLVLGLGSGGGGSEERVAATGARLQVQGRALCEAIVDGEPVLGVCPDGGIDDSTDAASDDGAGGSEGSGGSGGSGGSDNDAGGAGGM